MDWNHRPRTIELRFSASNPPPDRETAEQKAKELATSITLIELTLEEREVESYPSKAAYEEWRSKALKALVYIKAEAAFLEKWQLSLKKADTVQMIAGCVSSMVSDAQGQSTLLHQQPTNLQEAELQLRAFTEHRDKITAECVRLADIGKAAGMTRREANEIVAPLRILEEAAERERRVIRAYLSANDPDFKLKEYESLPPHAQTILNLAQALAEELAQDRPEISGPSNAPSDSTEAKSRRTALSAFRGKITRALQRITEEWQELPYTGGTMKAVNRPLVVLNASVEEEIRYLDGRIGELQQQAFQKEREEMAAKRTTHQQRIEELHQADQSTRRLAEERAAEIRSSYRALYTAERSPTDLEEARQRCALASATKQRLQAVFSEVADAWCQYPLNRADLPSVKRPLTLILNEVETELTTAKRFIAAQEPQPSSGKARWKSICIAALTRASFEGFKLTEEEKAVVQELIADLGSKSQHP